MQNLRKILESVNGSSFISMDTEVSVKLHGGRSNDQQGRVTKVSNKVNVMVFQNKKSNGYANMVHRRLAAEGKNPNNFKLSPRAWGTRIKDTPFVEHNGKYYLEVIVFGVKETVYCLDGKPISRDKIKGLVEPSDPDQGGLDDKVIVRVYALDSITNIRVNQMEYKGPFCYK